MQSFTLEQMNSKIYTIRNQKIMLDSELAEVYEVATKRLMEQVTRNIERFPSDFMFEITKEEFIILKSQNATSSWGGRRKLPHVFTEQGVYMLATVLKGNVARDVTISIMRTFTKLRTFSLSYAHIVKEIELLKEDSENHKNQTYENTKNIKLALEYLQDLLVDTKETQEKVMGFRP